MYETDGAVWGGLGWDDVTCGDEFDVTCGREEGLGIDGWDTIWD
jgi:hypothetical protein